MTACNKAGCNKTAKRAIFGLAMAAAMSMAIGLSAAVLAGASVSGKVTDEHGAVVANVRVAVMPVPNRDAPPAPAPKLAPGVAPQAAQDKKPERRPGAPGAPGAAPGGRQRPQPVAETETDADGKFTMTGIAAGNYVVVAGGREVGMARQRVELADGQTLEVELKLVPRPPRQPGGQPAPGN